MLHPLLLAFVSAPIVSVVYQPRKHPEIAKIFKNGINKPLYCVFWINKPPRKNVYFSRSFVVIEAGIALTKTLPGATLEIVK